MGKASKWFRSFLAGKKDHKENEKEKGTTSASTKDQNSSVPSENGIIPVPISRATHKEKRRWSFRRSSATAPALTPKDSTNSTEAPSPPPPRPPAAVAVMMETEDEQKKHALTVAATTIAAAAAAPAAGSVIRLTAAVKIQSYFRAYLARKALRALKGLVKLQALVRGHLVRKQATATLRCMQALVTLQTKALAQRVSMVEETKPMNPSISIHSKSTEEHRIKNTYLETDTADEENIKIVEMDVGDTKGNNTKSRNSCYSHHSNRGYAKKENHQFSPAPSAITDTSPYSGYFEDYSSFTTAQSSPVCYYSAKINDPSGHPFSFPGHENYTESISSYDFPLFPNYMANTESSRAKARSQSAPKQRPPELYERQSSWKRRASMEGAKAHNNNGNNVPRAVRMQRSSSHVGSTAKDYQYTWMAIKLDRSNVSLKESECGSTGTVLTNTNYCRSLAAYYDLQAHGND